jgi:hypothetical protein
MDLVPRVPVKDLDLVRMTDPVLVRRDTRAAADTETVTEMEAVPRDIRALALETDLVPKEALSLAPNLHLTMDTLEVATEVMEAEMAVDPANITTVDW